MSSASSFAVAVLALASVFALTQGVLIGDPEAPHPSAIPNRYSAFVSGPGAGSRYPVPDREMNAPGRLGNIVMAPYWRNTGRAFNSEEILDVVPAPAPSAPRRWLTAAGEKLGTMGRAVRAFGVRHKDGLEKCVVTTATCVAAFLAFAGVFVVPVLFTVLPILKVVTSWHVILGLVLGWIAYMFMITFGIAWIDDRIHLKAHCIVALRSIFALSYFIIPPCVIFSYYHVVNKHMRNKIVWAFVVWMFTIIVFIGSILPNAMPYTSHPYKVADSNLLFTITFGDHVNIFGVNCGDGSNFGASGGGDNTGGGDSTGGGDGS